MKTKDLTHALTQFRPGQAMGRWIAEYADVWQLTENETAKRLTAMAATRFDAGQYPLLLSLTDAMGASEGHRPDFVRACEQVKTAVDAANRTRQELGKKAMGHEERTDFVKRTVEELVTARQNRSQARNPKDRAALSA